MITNEDICEAFRSYFQELFTREPKLGSAQFDTHFTDFPRFETTKKAWGEGTLIKAEIWKALKQIGRDKIHGLPYEVHLRQSPLFVPLLLNH